MCPEVFSCSPSSSLAEVFGAYLVLPICPGHPAHPASCSNKGAGACLCPGAQGAGTCCCRPLQARPRASVCLPLDYRETWKSHMGVPRRACCKHIPCLRTGFKAPEQVLLSPVAQLDRCCQGEGMEAAIHMPWDAPWGTGSY